MRPRVAAVVALLAVTAGCGGFGSVGGGEGDSGSRTVNPELRGTPTATPSPTPVSTPPGGLPPGVSTDGVDVVRLFSAHRNALSNRSFTTLRTRVVRTPDGRSLVNASTLVRVDGSAERGRWTLDRRGLENYRRNQTAAYWTNGSVTVTRRTGTGEGADVTASGDGSTPGWATDVTGSRTIYTLLAEFDPRVAGTVAADGRRLVVLRSTGGGDGSAPEVRAADLRMFVAPDGTIVSYRLAYRTTRYGRETRVIARFDLSGVGTTDVDRPAWVGTALASNVTAEAGSAGGRTPASGGTGPDADDGAERTATGTP